MNISIENFKEFIKKSYLISIPLKYKSEFESSIYIKNLIRLKMYLVALIFIDYLSFFLYNFIFFSYKEIFNLLIAFLIKIVISVLLLIICSYFSKKDSYTNNNFIFYTIILYHISEMIIYIVGPQSLPEMIRFLVVPFIISNLYIIEQKKFLKLTLFLLFIEIIILGFLRNDVYIFHNSNIFIGAFIEFIIFVFVNLFSNLAYVGNVNNFLYEQKNKKIITQLTKINKKLKKLSNIDNLTELSNRNSFRKNILSIWNNDNKTVSIVIFDIDYLQRYNETYGTENGDLCIQKVAKIIKNNFLHTFSCEIDNNFISRTEGDEFTLIIFNREHNLIASFVDNIIKEVENLKIENPNSNVNAFITMSAGLATFNLSSGLSYQTVLKQAYSCLYFAKKHGCNQVICSIGENNNFQDENTNYIEKSDYSLNVKSKEVFFFKTILNEYDGSCNFLYSKKQNIVEFSNRCNELFNLPISILNPNKEKFSTNFNTENLNIFFKDLSDGVRNNFKDIFLVTNLLTKSTTSMNVFILLKCIYNDNKELESLSGYIIKINNLIQFNKFILDKEKKNNITLLPNRLKFHEDMEIISKNSSEFGYIVLLDIVDFKVINSIYSHNIGNRVLFEVSELINKISSKEGSVYNYSIDQFIIIFKHYDFEDTQLFMQRIQMYFKEQNLIIDDLNIRINFSMGAVEYKNSSKTIDELMIDLDITISKVKYDLKKGFGFFNTKDKTAFLDKASSENELLEAVENDFKGFFLLYQPIVDASTKKCVGAEALLRWNNSLGEIISPTVFIPSLELIGIIPKVEKWIFLNTCRQCKKWLDNSASDDFFIHINLSPLTIKRSTLTDEILDAIRLNKIDVKNIRLEVTESSVLSEMKNSVNILNDLRNKGIKIAVDDFGIGYSALSYLNSLPIDEIKIDKSFLVNIESNKSSAELLKSIAIMAKNMGYLVCVEGVENINQMKILENIKIDYIQGFYYSKPLPPNVLFNKFII